MVSFQCQACGDVIKKPKLDQHHGRCGAGFDCIDCHTSFLTPASYKGHTQCISEAEKYQKALYKGPKVNAIRGGRGGGRGGGVYQAQRRPIPNQATGANDTPLGTPSRMSPVTTPPIVSPPPAPASRPVTEGNPQSLQTPAPDEKRKPKKKMATVDAKEQVQAPVNSTAIEPASTSIPSSPVKPLGESTDTPKKKKSKKDKKSKNVQVEGADEAKMDVDGDSAPVPEGKQEKKRKRKSKAANVEAVEAPDQQGKKSEKENNTAEDESLQSKGEEKSKKRKRSGEEGDENAGEVAVAEKKKRKDKSKKAEKDADMSAADQSQKSEVKAEEKHDGSKRMDPDAMDICEDAAAPTKEKKKEKKEKKEKKSKKLKGSGDANAV
ncbi:hypothetical protein BV22DRAFT_422645 [Leucogyrophana mollusca]|uniref:Uncharacterized protein n=1 Tax=Leucogyrophana mollusca TaxID=85980 RepID=A0ACB8BJD4_9AGAM|nr:hypothetical protein BV22DRAFT_422645 [Leucogyrophana mollusca]